MEPSILHAMIKVNVTVWINSQETSVMYANLDFTTFHTVKVSNFT